ncbi:DUF2321 domain-containing protein [Paenibacillus sp. CAU 1782]
MNQTVVYDVAQICLNGHVNSSKINGNNHLFVDYCRDCGRETITKCVSCHKDIRGSAIYNGIPSYGKYNSPSFCIHCGQAFPWIAERLKAAEELAELFEELSDEDRKILTTSLNDLVRDTPRSQVAALRFKKIVAKAEEHIGVAFRDILLDVVTEPIKKMIWG